MLNANQMQHYDTVCEHFAGSAMAYLNDFDDEVENLSEDEVIEILIDADIEQCAMCGWWLYPGAYCSWHEHDEITCHDCCEGNR